MADLDIRICMPSEEALAKGQFNTHYDLGPAYSTRSRYGDVVLYEKVTLTHCYPLDKPPNKGTSSELPNFQKIAKATLADLVGEDFQPGKWGGKIADIIGKVDVAADQTAVMSEDPVVYRGIWTYRIGDNTLTATVVARIYNPPYRIQIEANLRAHGLLPN